MVCRSGGSIGALKDRISQALQIPIADMVLIRKNVELKDDDALDQYANLTIAVMPRKLRIIRRSVPRLQEKPGESQEKPNS